ncbi:LysR family transcriptional regulator [Aureimonas endophytica]|uniref:LysR family transcriptional regulator n=1 Tax=Aureimonas endophytica TaxID=2027858 RepID=A0A917A1M2_9HYPH|nr:LysR family transcriptional regulator [Aureimonas endophytica]GGE21313.1 LysR family transcriptional regulator [Aureimonas endophytica]
MNLRFLETFVLAARLNSFSAAAEKLNTTQAAASNRIATLERELGVRLFDRDTRGIRLTPEGRRALDLAEEIVRLSAGFREAVSNPAALLGTVRIGASDTIAYSWLPELIRRMRRRYPSVGIDVNIDTSLNLAKQIEEGRIDLGIIMGPVNAPIVHSIEICTFTSCWVASTSLELPATGLELADIAAYPLLTFSTGSQPHKALLRLLSGAGLDQFQIYNSNSLAIMTRMVSSGVGIGALPLVLVDDLVKAGVARILDIAPALPSLTFHVVYQEQSEDALERVITAMAQEIVSEARKPAPLAMPNSYAAMQNV